MKSNQVLTAKSFGEFLRLRRISLGFTLRSFSEQFGYDPGNISRIERNLITPSLDESSLSGYARALNIKPGSEEWVTFHDLAHLSKNRIPKDIADNANSNIYFPLLFRTLRGKKLSKEQLVKLVDLVNGKAE